jgi:hypothetical protein
LGAKGVGWSSIAIQAGLETMPLQYKLPGYLGNAALFFLSVVILAKESVITGLLLGMLSLLNLYLVYKLETFSRDEGLLEHELQMTKMREELAIAQKRLRELEGEATGSSPAPNA